MRYRSVLKLAIAITLLLCLAAIDAPKGKDRKPISNTYKSKYYKGLLWLKAPASVIEFPKGLVGLVFDTTDADANPDSSPVGSLGVLIVDSLVRGGTTVAVTDSSQLSGLYIHSLALQSVFKQLRIARLRKSFPGHHASDTIEYDSNLGEWKRVRSLYKNHHIEFDTTLPLESTARAIAEIPGVVWCESIPISRENWLDWPEGDDPNINHKPMTEPDVPSRP